MDKFLETFFKTQRMQEWRVKHPEQWQQFSDWAGRGTSDSTQLNSAQRKWLAFLERKAPGGATDPFVREPEPNGFLKIKNLPTAADLTDDKAWVDLYRLCQNAWYQMKNGNDYASYPLAVREFIDNSDKFFDDISQEVKEATGATKSAIDSMIRLLSEVAKSYPYALGELGTNDAELRSLINDCAAVPPKYNTSKKVRDKIIEIANNIVNQKDGSTKDELNAVAQSLLALPSSDKDALKKYTSKPLGEDFRSILDDYYGWNERATNAIKLGVFKTDFADFFQPIYKTQEIFDVFKANESAPNSVSKAVEKAKKDLDYDDQNSKNYVHPKRDDKLTVPERIEKWAGDIYEDYFKKYEGLMGGKKVDHYEEVKTIIKGVDKAKIKPTDGLTKFIENIDAIKNTVKFSNPRAAAAFEWLGNALKEFNADPKMSKTIKGALKSGRQMRNLISELVMRAAEDGKADTIEYAEIAMNVLRIIQYGATTSKIMNNMKEDKNLFNVLSNPDLSWNKNDAVKFITGAMDNTVRGMFMLVGRMGTFGLNKVRQGGKRFHGHRNGAKMEQSYSDWYRKNETDKSQAQKDYDADRGIGTPSRYFTAKNDAQSKQSGAIFDIVGGMTRHGGGTYSGASDEEILSKAEEDINKYKSDTWGPKGIVEQFKELINNLVYAKSIYEDDVAQLKLDEAAVLADMTLSTEQKTAQLGEIARRETEIKKEIAKEIGNNGKLDLSIAGITTPINLLHLKTIAPTFLDVMISTVRGHPDFINAQAELQSINDAIYDRQSRIDVYRKATQDIKDAEAQMEERKKRIDDWDKNHPDIYRRLMQYWDALQDPSLTSHRLGAKRIENGTKKINDLLASGKYSAWDPVR